jgi:hypothetical protein
MKYKEGDKVIIYGVDGVVYKCYRGDYDLVNKKQNYIYTIKCNYNKSLPIDRSLFNDLGNIIYVKEDDINTKSDLIGVNRNLKIESLGII